MTENQFKKMKGNIRGKMKQFNQHYSGILEKRVKRGRRLRTVSQNIKR